MASNEAKIEQLKLLRMFIKGAAYPSSFEKDFNFFASEHKNFEKTLYGTNCYAYALQLRYYLHYSANNYEPGFLDEDYLFNNTFESLKEGLIRDCNLLGIDLNEVSETETLPTNTYRIGIGWLTADDWHFIRQNVNGTWSEKAGWGQIPTNMMVLELAKENYKEWDFYSVSKKR